MKLGPLLSSKRLIRSLGVHDAFSAAIAARAGFECLFLGGFGATASLLGHPDLELLTLTEMADAVRRISGRLSVPLIADGDTGHGGVHNVSRTVREFDSAGAAGVIIEDQRSPKRCGHFEGKSVVGADEMAQRIQAAARARTSRDFVIVGRTDALKTDGFDEAVRRARLCAEAGADVVFVEALTNVDQIERLPRLVRAPVLINLLTGGRTPPVSLSLLESWGYRIAVFPIETLMVTVKPLERLARAALKSDSLDSLSADLASFEELQALLGLPEWNARAEALAAPESKKDMLTSVGSRRRKETPHVRRP